MAASKWASSTGFSMKSSAPALMAATAIGTSAWPEIRTTGRVMLRRGEFAHQLDAVHAWHAHVGDDAAVLAAV